MSDYDSSPKGLHNLESIFNQGMDYFNTHFPSSPVLEKETFFFGSNHSEIAIQSMEDRFKDSNTFGEFSTGNTFGETNFPYIQSDFQPSKTSWKSLYNENHTPKSNIGYHYSENINNSKLDIRYPNPDGGTPIASITQRRDSGVGTREPYIISDIPVFGELSGGRQVNFGSREFPIQRSTTDLERISKFLASPAGLMFIGKQEVLGAQGVVIVHDRKLGNRLIKRRQYKAFYNPLSTLMQVGPTNRFLGYGPNLMVDREFPTFGIEQAFVESEYGIDAVNKLTGGNPSLGQQNRQSIDGVFSSAGITGGNQISDFFSGLTVSTVPGTGTAVGPDTTQRNSAGDPHTILDMGYESGDSEKIITPGSMEDKLGSKNADILEGTLNEPYGMPFYFKDLRTSNYIAFRAYLDGITENIAPTWTPTNYVGRSEPVYVYERAERDISFNLKMFAQTQKELEMIYAKIDRLTSLCYPEYHPDTILAQRTIGKTTRMKPPMTKFRLGELFGNRGAELIGFIKSLTYSIPDEGVWETEYGKRVPKYVTAAINYQVIHASAPNLETKFYGYTGGRSWDYVYKIENGIDGISSEDEQKSTTSRAKPPPPQSQILR